MIKLLVKLFVTRDKNADEAKLREKYCILGGALGIVCNLVLFGLKLAVGSAMGSIAIISDAFNNLSDTGSSVVSVIGAKLSGRKPDKEHPFGHGRFEYVSSLIVSFIIILVGFELLKSSVFKIFHPEKVTFSLPLTVILCISVFVKVWMYLYNRYLGTEANSSLLLATARDSANDVISTSAVIATTIIGKFIDFPPLDGIIGTLVSVMILYSGFEIARDTIGLLLGAPPDPETVKNIRDCIIAGEGIVGVHDLIVHDYGPGRVFASVHAEVPDNSDLVKTHEIIDRLEQKIYHELGIETVIHMDPVSVNCEKTDRLRKLALKTVKSIDGRMNIHDFRITDGHRRINLIFDVEVPADYRETEHLRRRIADSLEALDPRFRAVISLDTIYE